MGRIAIDGRFVRFSTKSEISPALWNQRTQRANIAKGSSAEATDINERLAYITSRMLELYRELQEQHLDNLEKVRGVTIGPATVQKYDRACRHLAEFLKAEYRVSDIALCEINHMFITDWERYLRTKCNCGANTTAKFMQSFRMIVLMARNNGWLINVTLSPPLFPFPVGVPSHRDSRQNARTYGSRNRADLCPSRQ